MRKAGLVMNRIEKIFVTGTPKPQGRPRAFRRGKHVGVFSPTTEWKEAIKFQARNISQLNGALEISIDYFLIDLSLIMGREETPINLKTPRLST